ncbi:MAG: hypothetical protein GY913_15525 [Proteobacteria bacterium]|nr:hypothetical protein [Pseudomonadota bacterium]MCP4918319.1 hypothetical protein [Pseudomonadota bacterium]
MFLLLACAPQSLQPLADAGPDRVGPPGIPFAFESTDAVGEVTWTLLDTPEGSQLTDEDLIVEGERAWIVPDAPGLYLIEQEACIDLQCTKAEALAEAWGLISGAAPTADAGADQVGASAGDTVQLDASGSTDPEGDTLTYAWKFASVPAGSSLVFTDITDRKDVTAEFVGDVFGTYTLRVFVSDGTSTKADTVDITLSPGGNTAPVADAGSDLAVNLGDEATYDGSNSSDPDGDPLTYRWGFKTLPAASSLSNADWTDRYTTAGRFTPDAVGTYDARFVVMDGTDQDVDFAEAVVTSTSNTPPVADAGADTSGAVGTEVALDGSATSDVDGDTLSFRWGWKWVPVGSALTNADFRDRYTEFGRFTPDVAGTYQARLVVNDGADETVDIVDIVVTATNNLPEADASLSDTEGVVGDTVRLDGTLSHDADGDAFTTTWVFTQKPAGSALTNPDIAGRFSTLASFVPDVAGDYEIKLKADDGSADIGRDWVDITVYSYGYDDVQAVFDSDCTSCHSGGTPSSGMDLSGDAYTTIVDVESQDVVGMDLVEQGDSANSYLFHKIAGTHSSVGGAGDQMPKGGSALDTADQDLIETWIDEGAPDI